MTKLERQINKVKKWIDTLSDKEKQNIALMPACGKRKLAFILCTKNEKKATMFSFYADEFPVDTIGLYLDGSVFSLLKFAQLTFTELTITEI